MQINIEIGNLLSKSIFECCRNSFWQRCIHSDKLYKCFFFVFFFHVSLRITRAKNKCHRAHHFCAAKQIFRMPLCHYEEKKHMDQLLIYIFLLANKHNYYIVWVNLKPNIKFDCEPWSFLFKIWSVWNSSTVSLPNL